MKAKKVKKYEELWIKKRDFIRPITKNVDDCREEHMKVKINLDDKLPLNKTIEISTITIVVRIVFLEINKYYAQNFLNECLYKI